MLSVVVLWIYFFLPGPGYTLGGSGVMPVAVMLVVSAVVLVAVSLVTKPPAPATLDKFFPTAGSHR